MSVERVYVAPVYVARAPSPAMTKIGGRNGRAIPS